MAKDVKKIISIDTGQATTSLKDLRKEMSGLRDTLLNLEKGTEEYDKVQKRLIDDQEKIDSVMRATKKSVDALPGSYNALSNELAEVKKRWKETNDEAERNELGKRALELNNQLKGLDSSIGNFQRNVGDYSNSIKEAFIGILNGSISATAGISALKGALAGLLTNPVVALTAAFTTLVNALRNNAVAMASIHEGMRSMEPVLSVIRNAIGEIGKIIGPIIKELGEVLQPLLPILASFLNILLAPLKQIGVVLKTTLQILRPTATLIGNVLNPVLKATTEISDALIKKVVNGLNIISKPFKSFITMVISGVEGVINVLSKLPGMQDKFKDSIDALERIKVSIKNFKFDENDFTSPFSNIAEGVNQISNSYNALQQRLSDLKKMWAETNDEAERITLGKQIQEVEKELEEMEKSLHSSEESINSSEESIKALEGSYAALREELTNLTTQWENTNDQAERDVLAEKIKNINSQMVELAKQLEEAKEEESKVAEETEHLAGSYAALRDKLSNLKKQWEETNDEATRKGLASQIKEVDSQIKLLDSTTQGYNSMVLRGIETISKEIIALSNPLAVAKTATNALGNAMKSLIANPVGAFIMAIVAAVKLLKMGFEGSESASNKLKTAFAALEPITNAIKNGLTGIANVVGDILQIIPKLVEGVQSAGVKIAEILNKMGIVSDEKLQQMKRNVEEHKTLVDISVSLAQREIAIEDRRRDLLVLEAKTEMEISELRAKAAEKNKYTTEQITQFLEEAKDKEKKLMDERLAVAQEEFDIQKQRMSLTDNTEADYQKLAELEANLYKVKKEYNDGIRTLNKGIASNSKETNKTVKEEEDKTLEHLKATIQERMKLVSEGTKAYLDLKMQEEEVDWDIQEARLKKEKYTDQQIEVFRQAHAKRVADIQKQINDLYKEDVVEEDLDEKPILEKVKEINQLKLNLQNEYLDEYYKILKDQENAEYLESQIRLELEGATDEEIELVRKNHLKNLEDIDKQRLTKQMELNEELKEHTIEMRDSMLEALSSIGDAWESLLSAQLKTGKLSEKEYERRKKALQAFQIAAIVAQQAASIFDVWSGYAKEVGTINAETASATGPAAAITKAALDTKSLISAIAKTTALAATGAAQIAAVKSNGSNASASNSTMISANAQPDTAGLYSGMSYSRNVQTIQEEENLNRDEPIWVSVVDIENMRQRVIVRDAEATW